MTEPTHTVDASEPKLEKPFPDPAIPTVDRPGDGGEELPQRAPSPRDDMLDDVYADYEQRVQEQIDSQTREDIEAAGMPVEDEDFSGEEELSAEEGVSVEPMHPSAEPKEPELPSEFQQHPLADYIVMQNDEPFMKMNVNGSIVLKPLKDVASAENSMAAANERHRENAAWHKELQQREMALKQAETQPPVQPSVASPPTQEVDVNDEALMARAKEVVSEMFHGDEETAAEKMASVFKALAQAAPKAPQLSTDEIVSLAAAKVNDDRAREDFQRSVDEAWNRFKADFPDVASDPGLVRIADGMTDAIEAEHPSWSPYQVMAEAGNRTRAWIGERIGKNAEPEPTPAAEPEPSVDRQERKRSLTPLPQPKSATPQPEVQEVEQTPQDFLREIRESRGQAV